MKAHSILSVLFLVAIVFTATFALIDSPDVYDEKRLFDDETSLETTDSPLETDSPTTDSPATEAATTLEPVTEGPTTLEPATEGPTTQTPVTEGPATEAPVTEAVVTEDPTTQAHVATTLPATSETAAPTSAKPTSAVTTAAPKTTTSSSSSSSVVKSSAPLTSTTAVVASSVVAETKSEVPFVSIGPAGSETKGTLTFSADISKEEATDAIVSGGIDSSRIRIDSIEPTITKRDTATKVDFTILETKDGGASSVVLMMQLKQLVDNDPNALGVPATLKVVSVNYAAEYSTFSTQSTQSSQVANRSGSAAISVAFATIASLFVLVL